MPLESKPSILDANNTHIDENGREVVNPVLEREAILVQRVQVALADTIPGIDVVIDEDSTVDPYGRRRKVTISYPSEGTEQAREDFHTAVGFAEIMRDRIERREARKQLGVVEVGGQPLSLFVARAPERDELLTNFLVNILPGKIEETRQSRT